MCLYRVINNQSFPLFTECSFFEMCIHYLVWFGLVYLFIHSITHVTLDTSITVYNLHITTQLIIYGHPPSII